MFERIAGAEAKKLGRRVILRSDWESIKIPIIAKLVRQRFENDPALLEKLNTGDAMLVEENNGMINFSAIVSARAAGIYPV